MILTCSKLILLIEIVLGSVVPESGESTDLLMQLEKHRNHLAILVDSCDAFQGEEKKRVAKFLRAPISEALATDEQQFLLRSVVTLGRFSKGRKRETGFLEDTSILPILASALSDPDERMSQFAFDSILRYGKRADLKLSSEAIRSGLRGWPLRKSSTLLALVTESDEARQKMLSEKNLPLKVRARLGDAKAESELLTNFRTASSYASKREQAQNLGYVGSKDCASALFDGLSSKSILKATYVEISIRCSLIQQLGRIHQDNQLLTVKLRAIMRLGDDRYGVEKVKDYLNSVLTWGKGVFGGMTPNISTPLPLYRKMIIKRPLRRQ